MSLPDALAQEVDRRGISHREAAELVGVRQQNFSRWINGESRPTRQWHDGLARFLRVTKAQVKDMAGAPRMGTRTAEAARRLDKLEAEVDELRKLLVAIAARVGVEP